MIALFHKQGLCNVLCDVDTQHTACRRAVEQAAERASELQGRTEESVMAARRAAARLQGKAEEVSLVDLHQVFCYILHHKNHQDESNLFFF